MGGGLMQLVAYGAQDIYLTGNPQITFFKVVYRRHTNFSMESIEQVWDGSATTDGRCSATISRNGDLVYRMYLDIKTKTLKNDDSLIAFLNPGSEWIDNVSLEIGGQLIDRHSGRWMEVWTELTEPNPTGLVGIVPATGSFTSPSGLGTGTLFQNMTGMGGVFGDISFSSLNAKLNYTIPLYFWFCRNPGLALPLIALQYHEVKVILNHAIATIFKDGGGVKVEHNKLWCDYIYLDTDERRRFAQVSHEYLIEQVQEQSLDNAAGSHKLNFNHPVKELIWACFEKLHPAATNSQTKLCFEPIDSGTFHLKLNGHERFAPRTYNYFSRNQIWEHHTGPGGLDAANSGAGGENSNDGICVYSFALKPEEHQPSGTCNFSRIDNAELVSSTTILANSLIWAVNYNVLRIMSGMGGLAYSN